MQALLGEPSVGLHLTAAYESILSSNRDLPRRQTHEGC